MSSRAALNQTNLGDVSNVLGQSRSNSTQELNTEFSTSSRAIIIGSILGGVLGVAICFLFGFKFFAEFISVQYDDSFITYRYAFNLANGNGLRFNLGDDSNSASSLLYVLLLAILYLISRIDLMSIATTINVLSVGVMSSLIFLIFVRRGINRRNTICGIAAILMLGSSARLNYWTYSGMETAFFMMLLFVAIFFTSNYVTEHKYQKKTRTLLLTSLVLLTLTRVEGAIAATSLGALVMLFEYRSRSNRKFSKDKLLFVAVPPSVFACQLLFYWAYYGSPVSDPIGFKDRVQYYQRTPGTALDATMRYLRDENLGPVSLIASLVLFVLIFKQWKKLNRLAAPFACFVLLFLFVLRSPNSDEMRYELVLLVPLLIIAAELASAVIDNKKREFLLPVMTAVLIASLLSINTGYDVALAIEIRTSRYQYVQSARIEASKWLESNTEPGTIVISSDIGALAYYNPSNIYIDAPGLVNRTHLRNVVSGSDVFESLASRKPEILADTIGTDGVSGVEQIMSNPSGYYTAESGVTTTCPVMPFSKTELRVFPESPASNLSIQIARITGYNC